MPNFTEEAIKKSFLELINQKPINKITVKEISESCGINRNSFYYHFSDIPSLLEKILTEEAERLIQSQSESSSIYDYLLSAINFAIENKKAVYHIYNSANREMFERYLERISRKAVTEYMENMYKNYNLSDEDKKILIMYYKCQIVGFVIDWLGSGMKYDLCIQLRRICQLFKGSMEKAFIRSQEEYEKLYLGKNT